KTGKQTAGGSEPVWEYDAGTPGNINDDNGNNTVAFTKTLVDNAQALVIVRVTKDTDQTDGAAGIFNGTMDGILATFTEAMDASTASTFEFSITRNDGTLLTESYADTTDDTTLFFGCSDCPTNNTSDLLKLQVTNGAGGIQDLAGVTALTEGSHVAATDEAPPFILTRTYQDSGNDGSVDRLVLTFTENTLWNETDPSQFDIQEEDLTSFTGVSTVSDSGTTILTLTVNATSNLTGVNGGNEPTLQYTQSGTPANHLQDSAGNSTANEGSTTDITDGAAPVNIATSYVDSDNDGKVDQSVSTWTEDTTFAMAGADWVFTTAGDVNLTGDFALAECAGTGSTNITCTDVGTGTMDADADKTGLQTVGGTEPVWTYTNNSGNVNDGNGNNTVGFAKTFIDTAEAIIVSRITKDTDNVEGAAGTEDGTMDGILASFSEVIDVSTIGTSDFELTTNAGGALTEDINDTTDDLTIFFQCTDCPAGDTSDLLKLQITNGGTGILDYNGNVSGGGGTGIQVFTEGASVAATDGANPFILTQFYRDSSDDGTTEQLEINFSEIVTWNAGDLDQWTLVNNDLTDYDDDGTPESLVGGSGSGQLTLSTTGTTDLTGVSGGIEPTLEYIQSDTAGNRILDAATNELQDRTDTPITDGAAPVVKVNTITYEDANNDGTIDQTVSTWTENTIFTMASADWDFGTAGDVNLTGDFDNTECAGSGSDTITCTDVGAGDMDADTDKTGLQTAGGDEPV
ncbi:MAG: hypothetical protein U1C97_00415, partial [Candidatus Gracilibacteria bacterium]|nr:hypothetical protein [Candidatus Gracilibacteria bacterium]